jgi:hypothetical protein
LIAAVIEVVNRLRREAGFVEEAHELVIWGHYRAANRRQS